MSTTKHGLIKPDEKDKKAVQELLEMRRENADRTSEGDHHFQEALQEEFHRVWEGTIKPSLQQLKATTDEVLERFTEFEDDFRGYLRNKSSDVDVELLEEIFSDRLRAKDDEKDRYVLSENTDQT